MMQRLDFLGTTQIFDNPIEIIQTSKIDQVIDCLARVERATSQGYYAVGYIAYEAAPAFDAALRVANQNEMPLIWFGIYTSPSDDKNNTYPQIISQTAWQADVSSAEYKAAICEIKRQIELGNTYQTNYTIRLSGLVNEDPYAIYQHLLQAQKSDYSAYLELENHIILSASPELFFHYKAGKVVTKPMKGTAARGLTLTDDLENKSLLANEKNQAENMMIVDLLRNDLNRIAYTGSVQVPKLFEAEQYPTVWQMTSTITADVPHNISIVSLFQALFPCGSITGAPKESTMQIIAELEKQPRGVYCGAIGVITPNNEAIFNVAIRTLTIDKQTSTAQYGVGGGITWDSTAEDEYEEIVNKTRILHSSPLPQSLLESLLLDDSHYFLLDRHLQRLKHSAQYFGFRCDLSLIRQELDMLAMLHQQGQWKVRLLMNYEGKIELESTCISTSPTTPLRATWSPVAIDSKNRFLYHKTTNREFYPSATFNQEFLLFNERDEMTEFVNGNVALLIDGQWLTPVHSSGLLAGTMREHLLSEQKLKEALLYRDDLLKAEKIVFINSVRKWREVIWQSS